MCFQALAGCLRPTIDSETLSKDPKRVFQFVKDKISGMNGDEYVPTDKLSPCSLKQTVGVFGKSLRVSGRPQAAHQSLKACLRCQLLRMPQGGRDGHGCCRE